jgi:hypothetical protein
VTTTAEQTSLLQQLERLGLTKSVLLDRLERVLTALALTLDAEAATEEQLSSVNGDLVLRMHAADGHSAAAASYRRILQELRRDGADARSH